MKLSLISDDVQNSGREISEPHYRVVNKAMYGGSAERKLGNILAPGTYWTPRWDSVVMMLRSIIKHYSTSLPKENWETTVYQLNKAIMADPPKEHKWAFQYSVDAGEQILVKALEQPIIATDPETGIKISQLLPSEFLMVCTQDIEIPIDWETAGVEAILDGQKVYIGYDYDSTEITINKKEKWKFVPILHIRSIAEWSKIYKRLQIINPESQGFEGLMWFMHDMEQDGIPRWK